jgi:hypothetical protein
VKGSSQFDHPLEAASWVPPPLLSFPRSKSVSIFCSAYFGVSLRVADFFEGDAFFYSGRGLLAFSTYSTTFFAPAFFGGPSNLKPPFVLDSSFAFLDTLP